MSLNRRWGCALQIEEACKNDASDGRLDALLASVLHQPKSFKLKLAPDTYNDEQRTKFTFQSAEACDWDVECKVCECCLFVIGQRGLGLFIALQPGAQRIAAWSIAAGYCLLLLRLRVLCLHPDCVQTVYLRAVTHLCSAQ